MPRAGQAKQAAQSYQTLFPHKEGGGCELVHVHTPNKNHIHVSMSVHTSNVYEGSTKVHLLLQFDHAEFTHAEHRCNGVLYALLCNIGLNIRL